MCRGAARADTSSTSAPMQLGEGKGRPRQQGEKRGIPAPTLAPSLPFPGRAGRPSPQGLGRWQAPSFAPAPRGSSRQPGIWMQRWVRDRQTDAVFSREPLPGSGNWRVFDIRESCPRNEGKVENQRACTGEKGGHKLQGSEPAVPCQRAPADVTSAAAVLQPSRFPSVASSPGEAADTREFLAPATSSPSRVGPTSHSEVPVKNPDGVTQSQQKKKPQRHR